MKTMMKELAANVNRVMMSIGHLFDTYEKVINELSGTPVYMHLYETHEMM